MGVKHGSLTRAGKVRKQTPKVDKVERAQKVQKGRAAKRIKFNRRYLNTVMIKGKKASPNANAGKKE